MLSCVATYALAGALPRSPSELLLVGDSVTAGIYFLSLNAKSIRQAWSAQLIRRLGMNPPRAPYDITYPINHLGLAELGFTAGGLAYAWEARHSLRGGSPRFAADEERIVMAVPGQTLDELLRQSSRTKRENKHSSGWTFGRILLPKGLSAIETIEQWEKRPRWVVVFIGANDLLASFNMVGKATSSSPEEFRQDYEEVVGRLRRVMAADAPPEQFLVMTLPDVTKLPLLQELPPSADDGHGHRYPLGSVASTFLLPYRKHFEGDEVWTPDELDTVSRLGAAYNDVIRDIAVRESLTVVEITELLARLSEGDSTFSAPASPYFSPDLHHPSFRTHRHIADWVLEEMAAVAGVAVPPEPHLVETPLPHAGDFEGKNRDRVSTLMHLAVQGLSGGPLPPGLTGRLSVDAGAQAGKGRLGRGAVALLAGLDTYATPVSTHWLARLGARLAADALVWNDAADEVDFFPEGSVALGLGIGFERTGAWHWFRLEPGMQWRFADGADFGWYARGEWRWLFAEVSSGGGTPDRFAAGVRLGRAPGRPSRNGN
jgi:hypothetical protein